MGKDKIRNIPEWCHFHKDMNKDNHNCCNCGSDLISYQQGDGKVLHSLCYNCHYGRNLVALKRKELNRSNKENSKFS